MEAIWVAAEMRAGAAYAHALLALDALEENAARASRYGPSDRRQNPEELTVEVPSPDRVTVTVAPSTRVPERPVATIWQVLPPHEG